MSVSKFRNLFLSSRGCRAFATKIPEDQYQDGQLYTPRYFNDLHAFIPPIKAMDLMTPTDRYSHIIPFNSINLRALEEGEYQNFKHYSQCLTDFTRFYYSTASIYSLFKSNPRKGDPEWVTGGFGNIVAVSLDGAATNRYITNAHILAPKLIRENNLQYYFNVTDKYEYYGVDKVNNERIHPFNDAIETEWNLQHFVIYIPGCGGSFKLHLKDLNILYYDNVRDIIAFEIPDNVVKTVTTAQCSMILPTSDDNILNINNVENVENIVGFGNWNYEGINDEHPVTDIFNCPISTTALKQKFGNASFIGWNIHYFKQDLVDYLQKEPMFPQQFIPKHLINIEKNDESIECVNHYLFTFASASGSPISFRPSEIGALHTQTKRITGGSQTVFVHNRAALITKDIIASVIN